MKIIKGIKKVIKSNEQLYKFIRPIELKYDISRNRIRNAYDMAVQFLINPVIRKKVWREETKDLLKFHNIHKGQRIFVIATGPSLREEDVLKLKDEITMSVNEAVALVDTIGWRPTYYFIVDPSMWLWKKNEINNAGYKDVFMSINNMKEFEADFSFVPHYFTVYKNIRCILETCEINVHGKLKAEFSDDIYLKGAYGDRSVVTVAVQMAAYMGASEIYLLGQDCDYSGPKSYFCGGISEIMQKNPKFADRWASSMFAFYRTARQYCEAHHIKLYNATRGGRLEELERVDFDKVVK